MGRTFTALMSAGLAACVIGPPYIAEDRVLVGAVLAAALLVSWCSLRAGALIVCWTMPILGLITAATRHPRCFCGDPPPPRAEYFGLLLISLFAGALLTALMARRTGGPGLPIARIHDGPARGWLIAVAGNRTARSR